MKGTGPWWELLWSQTRANGMILITHDWTNKLKIWKDWGRLRNEARFPGEGTGTIVRIWWSPENGLFFWTPRADHLPGRIFRVGPHISIVIHSLWIERWCQIENRTPGSRRFQPFLHFYPFSSIVWICKFCRGIVPTEKITSLLYINSINLNRLVFSDFLLDIGKLQLSNIPAFFSLFFLHNFETSCLGRRFDFTNLFKRQFQVNRTFGDIHIRICVANPDPDSDLITQECFIGWLQVRKIDGFQVVYANNLIWSNWF